MDLKGIAEAYQSVYEGKVNPGLQAYLDKKKGKKGNGDDEKENGKENENGKESKGSKPDFLDLDKDGNKKEPMKKAAKDKKMKEEVQQVDEFVGAALGALGGAALGKTAIAKGLTTAAATKAAAIPSIGGAVSKALGSKIAPQVIGSAAGAGAGEAIDPLKKTKDKDVVKAAALGGAAPVVGKVVGDAVGKVKNAVKKEETEYNYVNTYLDELKKTTMGSYIKKAAVDASNRSFDHGESEKRQYEPDKADEKEEKKIANRVKGIARAAKKLTKEHHQKDADGNTVPHEEEAAGTPSSIEERTVLEQLSEDGREIDAFEAVISYLLDEGLAEYWEEAEKIMTTLKPELVEEVYQSQLKKLEEKVGATVGGGTGAKVGSIIGGIGGAGLGALKGGAKGGLVGAGLGAVGGALKGSTAGAAVGGATGAAMAAKKGKKTKAALGGALGGAVGNTLKMPGVGGAVGGAIGG